MQCHSCGADVRPGQKFCMECGTSLHGISDSTGEVPVIRAEQPASDQVRDEVTRAMGTMKDRPDGAPATGGRAPADDGQLFAPPTLGDRATSTSPSESPSASPWEEDPDATRPVVIPADDDPDDHRETRWRPGADDRPSAESTGTPSRDAAAWPHDPDATVQLPVDRRPPDAADDDRTMRMASVATAAGPAGWTATDTVELPAAAARRSGQDRSSDGYSGRAEYDRTGEYDAGEARRTPRAFRFRILLALGVLALGAAVTGALSTVVEINGSGTGLDGIWKVNDLGTNNALAAVIAGAAMVVGALLWCFGFKWGAGLAGGAGAALAGWAALFIGLIEWRPIDEVRLLTDGADITRGIGYWAVVTAGGLGALALLVSFGGSGRDRQGGLDPWIAALGAASFLVAAGGPLIPLGTADVSGNFDSDSLGVDFPTVFFVGRLVQLGLLALCGVLGFLLVRRYGLGLAVGSALAAGWMVVTAATEQTDSPIGLGFTNPGAAGNQPPHGVTVVGMALAGFFALVAIVMALLDHD